MISTDGLISEANALGIHHAVGDAKNDLPDLA